MIAAYGKMTTFATNISWKPKMSKANKRVLTMINGKYDENCNS